MSAPPRAKSGLSIALAVVALVAAIDVSRTRAAARLVKLKDDTDVYALPPPAYVDRGTIGYRDAVASVLWASILYQYGVHVGQNRRFPFATQYLRTIVELAPTFKPAFRFASTFVSMQALPPSHEEIVITREILEGGLEALPSDPDVWGAYASFMMFDAPMYLPDDEKNEWRVKGALAAQRAVELGYVLDNLGVAGALQLVKAGHRDLAIDQLRRAYAIAPDDETRASIGRRLERLEGRAAREEVARTIQAFTTHWNAEAPFVDEDAFVIVGPARATAACAGRAGNDIACSDGWDGAIAAFK